MSAVTERSDRASRIIQDSPVLTTKRLILRQPHRDDAQDMAALANNFEVARMLASMPYPYFDTDAREFLDRVLGGQEKACIYAVTLGESGRFIGICGLHDDAERSELPFIGYWLGEPYWGKGYATEAARALVDLYFKTTDLEFLQISCARENRDSLRVIEKCGGEYWKPGEEYSAALGRPRPIDHYRVSRASWMDSLAA